MMPSLIHEPYSAQTELWFSPCFVKWPLLRVLNIVYLNISLIIYILMACIYWNISWVFYCDNICAAIVSNVSDNMKNYQEISQMTAQLNLSSIVFLTVNLQSNSISTQITIV